VLSSELMGILALGVLWVNTLLIVAAAGQRLSLVRQRLRRYAELAPGARGTGLIHVTLTDAERDDGIVAERSLSQIGRYGTKHEDRILFNDTSYASSCGGGAARWGEHRLRIVEDGDCEVWPSEGAVRSAAACRDGAQFDAAHAESRRVKGFVRVVSNPVVVGDEVWLYGSVASEHGELRIHAPEGTALLFASEDPRRWCRQRVRILLAGQVGMLLGAAACTALVFTPPVFGTVSTVGAALALAFFILVQPFGKVLHEYSRPPHEQILRGEWQRPSGSGA